MNRAFFIFFLSLILFSCQPKAETEQTTKQKATKKAWQSNQAGAAAIFAQDALSTGREFAISFTPNGKEAYFTRSGENGALSIYQANFDGENWSTPQPATFSGEYRDADPFVTYDGQRLFFMSFRPRNPGDTPLEAPDIWYVDREGDDWSDPVNLEIVNTDFGEGFPSVALNGNLYFPSDREGDNNDIYVSIFQNGNYTPPARLSDSINTPASESNPGISPDENLLFFYSNREGILGAVDLFVCRKENGSWTSPVALGEEVNSPDADYCPYVSPDMNYLFFSRGIRTDTSNINLIYSIALDRVLDVLE